MLSSHVKRSPLLWLHNKWRLSQRKNYWSEMVSYFIGVHIINRTLHGRAEIRNFPSRVEKIIHLFAHFSTLEEKFPISARPCNPLFLGIQWRAWGDFCACFRVFSKHFCTHGVIILNVLQVFLGSYFALALLLISKTRTYHWFQARECYIRLQHHF